MKQFMRLSLRENSGRLIGPVLIVFFAAAMMTLSLAFAGRDMTFADLALKQVFGGEVLVFTSPYLLPHNVDGALRYQHVDGLSEIQNIYPQMAAEGYLASFAEAPDIDITALAEADNVASCFPTLLLPVKVNGEYKWLRGRNLQQDRKLFWQSASSDLARSVELSDRYLFTGRTIGVGQTAIDGRYFSAGDGTDVCLIAENLVSEARSEGSRRFVRLEVPRVLQLDGVTRFDFSSPTAHELRVIGVVQTQIASDLWVDTEDPTSHARSPGFYNWDGILVPDSTWTMLFRSAGGLDTRFLCQYVINLEDPAAMGKTLRSLEVQFPGLTFLPVSRMQDYMTMTVRQGAHPFEMDSIVNVLVFIISGVVLGGTMYLSVLKRRKEIAILKAVGVTRREIVLEIVGECLMVTLAGSLIAVIGTLSLVSLTMLTNRLGSAVLRTNIATAAQVIMLAFAISVLSALIPAFKASNMTCMEVLRDV